MAIERSKIKPWIFTSRTMNTLGIVADDLIRQTKEETGIQLRVASLLGVDDGTDAFKEFYAVANRSTVAGHIGHNIWGASQPNGDLEGMSIGNQRSGQIYGALVVSPFSAHRGSLELSAFATIQRTGLPAGSILLAELIYLIFLSGEFPEFREITLSTNIDSRAGRMYERMGFVKKNDAMILRKDVITHGILHNLVRDRSFTNIQPRQIAWRKRHDETLRREAEEEL
jgi:ribosomal protein S18 acetylase RimI-like enzyme